MHSVTCSAVRIPQIFTRLLAAPGLVPAYHSPAISHWPPIYCPFTRARVLPTSTSESRSQKHRTTSDQLCPDPSPDDRPLALELCICVFDNRADASPERHASHSILSDIVARPSRRCVTPAISLPSHLSLLSDASHRLLPLETRDGRDTTLCAIFASPPGLTASQPDRDGRLSSNIR